MADYPERGISEEELLAELDAAVARESGRGESDGVYSDIPDYLEQAVTDTTLSEKKAGIIADDVAEYYTRQFQRARNIERINYLLELHTRYFPGSKLPKLDDVKKTAAGLQDKQNTVEKKIKNNLALHILGFIHKARERREKEGQ